MIKPLFNAQDDEWVLMLGRFMMNMGAIEAATRIIIVKIEGSDSALIFSHDLSYRISYIRKRFPRTDSIKHQGAMTVLNVAAKLSSFRNIVAHSPLSITENQDGTFHTQGIINFTPKDPKNAAQIISLAELTGRVNESANVGRHMLEMQNEF